MPSHSLFMFTRIQLRARAHQQKQRTVDFVWTTPNCHVRHHPDRRRIRKESQQKPVQQVWKRNGHSILPHNQVFWNFFSKAKTPQKSYKVDIYFFNIDSSRLVVHHPQKRVFWWGSLHAATKKTRSYKLTVTFISKLFSKSWIFWQLNVRPDRIAAKFIYFCRFMYENCSIYILFHSSS